MALMMMMMMMMMIYEIHAASQVRPMTFHNSVKP